VFEDIYWLDSMIIKLTKKYLISLLIKNIKRR